MRHAWSVAVVVAAACVSHPPDLPMAVTLGAGDTGTGLPDPDSGGLVSTGQAEVSGSSDDGDSSDDGGSTDDGDSAGEGDIACDTFSQDCGIGEKCMPVALDGNQVWNATRCMPLDPSPDPIGSACTVEESAASGVDSCEAGSMCWNVDEALEGTCIELCGGSAGAPTCETQGTSCVISNSDALAVCLPSCTPLDPSSCASDEGCYLVESGLACAPDASGKSGVHGDPCEAVNGCDPGMLCVGAMGVPGCGGAIGCCAAACDVSMAMAPACPDQAECTSLFVDGMAPREWTDLGVCVAP